MKKLIKLIFIIFIFSTYLKPAGFDLLGFDAINQFFNISRIIITIFIFYFYFKKIKKLSRFLKYECWFFLCLGISTCFSGKGIDTFVIFSVSIVALSMLIELLIKENINLLIKGLFSCYFILLIGNLIYMLSLFGFTINIEEAYPEAFDYNSELVITLLSSVNGVAFFIFPALCSAILLMFATSKKNIWSWLLIIISFVTELILWSATSLTGVFIILVYVLFIYGKKIEKFIMNKIIIGAALAISLGVTFFNIQHFFSFIIVDILHKDLTMTGRTNVWNIGYKGFFSSPIWGCGISSQTIDNGFVQCLYMAGLIGTLFFIIFISYNIKYLCSSHDKSIDKFFSVVMAVVLLMFMSESWPQFMGLYVILALSVNARTIERKLPDLY